MASDSNYYVPEQSKLPVIASVFLFMMFMGLGHILNGNKYEYTTAWAIMLATGGFVLLLTAVFNWFSITIKESHAKLHGELMDKSYRLGMSWFIYTEVMFFATFFGALFYIRYLGIPWLSSEGDKPMNILLWPEFIGTWPLFETPDPSRFEGPTQIVNPLGVPLLNTIILVSSSFTLTWAHHSLKEGNRAALRNWMLVTIALGLIFLFFQVEEYIHAYTELGLRFDSGIYGNLFFLLTGFHGLHVTLGTIMLIVVLARIMSGHFSPQKHFAYEAVAWYWHFVDVVWIALFLFVYIL